jgi:hypothetical protein
VGAQGAQSLQPIPIGSAHVDEHEIGACAADGIQKAFLRTDAGDLRRAAEGRGDEVGALGIVIREQNLHESGRPWIMVRRPLR